MEQYPQRLKENKFLLYILNKAKPRLRNAIINHCDSEFIKTLSEISLNFLKGNITHSKNINKKLKKFKKKLRTLACSKRSVKVKRNILNQKGGFLPTLIASLLPIIISQFIK